MNRPCAICIDFSLPPRETTNTISVATERPSIGDHHVATVGDLPVCPEHAVDVYRGRVPGVAMAWRVLAAPTLR